LEAFWMQLVFYRTFSYISLVKAQQSRCESSISNIDKIIN
jgi:hypothetical protein